MHFQNDTELYSVIGANIKHYREQQNLTQVQLAEQAKISLSLDILVLVYKYGHKKLNTL